MKPRMLILLLLMVIAGLQLNAQENACSKTPFNCNANLTLPQFAENEILKELDVSYAKPNPNPGQKTPDVDYKNECVVRKVCHKEGADLKYDVFYPSGHDYNACPLPVIFLFHPGNFSDCSFKEESHFFGLLFSQRGFISICVEYRRGTEDDSTGKISASKTLALYRASQDGRGVIRSVIARQQNAVSPPYKIDFNNIFIGDAGTNPLNIAYINTQVLMDETAPGVKDVLGPLNADYYYGDTSIKYKIKGVFNESGGLLVKASKKMYKLFAEQGIENLPALISFHGGEDPLISLDTKYEYFSTLPRYRTETFCTGNKNSYSVPENNGGVPDLAFLGSRTLYDILEKQEVFCELYIDTKMKHALSTSTGFGTGITNTDSLRQYLAQRVATFFQSVINKTAGRLKTSIFTDCENFRYGCKTADANDNCGQKKVITRQYPPSFKNVQPAVLSAYE